MDSNDFSSTDAFLLIGFIVISLLVLIIPIFFRRTHEQNVELWARENQLKILNLEFTERAKTPFSSLMTRKSENFYRIKVLTKEGVEKSGYICVSGQLSAFFTPKARAIWDSEKQISQKSTKSAIQGK